MKLTGRIAFLLMSFAGSFLAHAQITSFKHVILVIQENRTPDNLFQGLCSAPYGTSASCNTSPDNSEYDIQTSNWIDKTSSTGVTQPFGVTLQGVYDMQHAHSDFVSQCDINSSRECRMDDAAGVICIGTCPASDAAFGYVTNSDGILDPYLNMATSYGWGNYMFQTNQGPSFPAHQYLFGGTSAPTAADDAIATFAAENLFPNDLTVGCIADTGITVELITTHGENQAIYPCFEHQTLSDLLNDVKVSWKYYTPNNGTTIWTAPNAIKHICEPSKPTAGVCQGIEWKDYVISPPSRLLTDITNCQLSDVSWVIPTGQDSDHADSNTGGGPAWVASIVNQIGNNPKCKDGETYWDNTVILVTWDDWGGWYDHEPPTILAGPQGDYQYGMRVPFMVVSAYTPAAYIDNTRMDFGTILRFVENNYGIAEGALNFADARSSGDLAEYFNLKQVPRVFQTIPAPLDANFFINDKTPPTDPDDD
jgi:phospholipase C